MIACCHRFFQRLGRRAAVPGANTVIVSVVVAIVAGLVDSGYLWDMVSLGRWFAFIVSANVPVMRRTQAHCCQPSACRSAPTWSPLSVPGLPLHHQDLSAVTFKVFAVWMVVAVGAFLAYRRLANRGRQADAARRAWKGVAECFRQQPTPKSHSTGLDEAFPLKSTCWLNDYFSPC